ncbi:MAG: hypothetical protein JO173_02140, partial [Gammaproteobacteria bacterium]|nr:hypothetical protein [Gammaproteobacteria bacterium]
MRHDIRLLSWLPVLLGILSASAPAAESRTPFTVEDLVVLKRLTDPQVSPDGRYLVYVQRET